MKSNLQLFTFYFMALAIASYIAGKAVLVWLKIWLLIRKDK